MSSGSVKVTTYRIGNSADVHIRHIEQARWDILTRVLEVFRNGFVKKQNSDGWSTLAAAAYHRNIVVSDNTAAPHQITPRLLTLMQVAMKRSGGGNMTSSGFKLTDLYISPEASASMRSWDFSLVPESVRTQMFAKMPVRKPGLEVFADNSSYTHRSQTFGYYGWLETGFLITDHFMLLGSF